MNIDKLVKATAIIVGVLCVIGIAVAGTTSVTVNDTAVFRPDGGVAVNIKAKADKTAIAQCMEMAKTTLGKSTCTDVYGITTTGTCDDIQKPVLPRELDADGYVIKPPIRAKQLSDTDWQTEIQDYVPAPFPTCWVIGWRVIADADLIDDTPQVAVMEPTWHTPEEKAYVDAFNAQWQARQDAADAACAAGDSSQCPLIPNQQPGACGAYNSAACNPGIDGPKG